MWGGPKCMAAPSHPVPTSTASKKPNPREAYILPSSVPENPIPA